MTQKIIEVVGTSKESFTKAAENGGRSCQNRPRTEVGANGRIAIRREECSSIPGKQQRSTSTSNTKPASRVCLDLDYSIACETGDRALFPSFSCHSGYFNFADRREKAMM